MFLCSYCQIFARPKSRIVCGVKKRCRQNNRGTCFACQKLSNIDRKIEDARRALEKLLDEKEQLASVLNDHHDPFSSQLPVEVVSRIFLHCRSFIPSAHTTGDQYNGKRLINSVLTPGRVSRNWRKIARSYPKLWTVMCMTLNESNYIKSVPFIHEWLKLSRELPLFLQLRVSSSTNEVLCSVARRALLSLVQHAQRWRVLDISVPYYLLPWITNAMPAQRLDWLEHLKIDVGSDGVDYGDVGETLCLQASPRLLTQRGAWFSQFSINMDQLTHFFVPSHFVQVDEFIQLLREAPRLSFCHIASVKESASSSEDVASAKSLRTLIIDQDFPGDLWINFSFPSLEVLRASGPIGPVLDVLKRSSVSVGLHSQELARFR